MPDDPGSERAVALLIAAAVVVGVAFGARSTLLSDSASDEWKSSVRAEVKRAAASVEDIRFVFVSEAPLAMQVIAARVRGDELAASAAQAGGLARSTLLAEAQAMRLLAAQIAESAPNPDEYRTSSGGFDTARRLADQRRRFPDLVALDPDADQAAGDGLSRHAFLAVLAVLPAAVAFLLGALAEAFHRIRRPLVLAGSALVIAALVFGIVAEFV